MFQYCLNGFKSTANLTEQVPVDKEKAIESAIKNTAVSKAAAENARKTDEKEISRCKVTRDNLCPKMVQNFPSTGDRKELMSIHKKRVSAHIIKASSYSKADMDAISKHKAVLLAIKAAAEMSRKSPNKTGIARRSLEGNTPGNILQSILNGMGSESSLENKVSSNKQMTECFIKPPTNNSAELIRVSKQKAIQRALKVAADSKAAAEMARKTADEKKMLDLLKELDF